MKTYLAGSIFSADAARALGLPPHVHQVDFIIVALRKADIGPLCEDRGLSGADHIAKAARVNDKFSRIVTLREAGFAPADEVAVYVTPDAGGTNRNVLRVNLDGSFEPVAHIVYEKNLPKALPGLAPTD